MILLWCDVTYSNTTDWRRNYKKHEVIFNRLNRLAMLTSTKQEHIVSCAFQATVPPLNGLFANIMHKHCNPQCQKVVYIFPSSMCCWKKATSVQCSLPEWEASKTDFNKVLPQPLHTSPLPNLFLPMLIYTPPPLQQKTHKRNNKKTNETLKNCRIVNLFINSWQLSFFINIHFTIKHCKVQFRVWLFFCDYFNVVVWVKNWDPVKKEKLRPN
jgi:hypothetical protein